MSVEKAKSDSMKQAPKKKKDTEPPAILSQTKEENKAIVDSFLNTLLNAPKARKQHYYFAHRVLPAMAFANPEKVLAMLKSAEGNAFLLDLWNTVGEMSEDFSAEDRVAPEGLSYSIRSMDEQLWIIIIQLPVPIRRNEAYFVGLVFSPTRRSLLFWKPAISVRYFTLEIGAGRTILGEWTKSGHGNYGEVPGTDEEAFVKAIIDNTAKK